MYTLKKMKKMKKMKTLKLNKIIGGAINARARTIFQSMSRPPNILRKEINDLFHYGDETGNLRLYSIDAIKKCKILISDYAAFFVYTPNDYNEFDPDYYKEYTDFDMVNFYKLFLYLIMHHVVAYPLQQLTSYYTNFFNYTAYILCIHKHSHNSFINWFMKWPLKHVFEHIINEYLKPFCRDPRNNNTLLNNCWYTKPLLVLDDSTNDEKLYEYNLLYRTKPYEGIPNTNINIDTSIDGWRRHLTIFDQTSLVSNNPAPAPSDDAHAADAADAARAHAAPAAADAARADAADAADAALADARAAALAHAFAAHAADAALAPKATPAPAPSDDEPGMEMEDEHGNFTPGYAAKFATQQTGSDVKRRKNMAILAIQYMEDITEEQFHTMMKSLHNIDLSKVIELDDNTDLSGELACAGGACEIK